MIELTGLSYHREEWNASQIETVGNDPLCLPSVNGLLLLVLGEDENNLPFYTRLYSWYLVSYSWQPEWHIGRLMNRAGYHSGNAIGKEKMEQPNRSDVVDQFMQKLEHPLKAEVEAVREIILDSDPQITEQIKWNAPSFCYQVKDRITFRLAPATDSIQLIFHRGAKVKDSSNFEFKDDSGLLKWLAKDRAAITFRSMDEVKESAAALRELVSRWMTAAAG